MILNGSSFSLDTLLSQDESRWESLYDVAPVDHQRGQQHRKESVAEDETKRDNAIEFESDEITRN